MTAGQYVEMYGLFSVPSRMISAAAKAVTSKAVEAYWERSLTHGAQVPPHQRHFGVCYLDVNGVRYQRRVSPFDEIPFILVQTGLSPCSFYTLATVYTEVLDDTNQSVDHPESSVGHDRMRLKPPAPFLCILILGHRDHLSPCFITRFHVERQAIF